MRSLAPGPSKGFARIKQQLFPMLYEDVSDTVQIALATAQRIDKEAKITASVR